MSENKFEWDDKNVLLFVQYAYGNLPTDESLKIDMDRFKQKQREMAIAKVDRCSICGGEMVFIRGKYPNSDRRQVCPTCNTERLEQINEISSKYYGVACKVDSNLPIPSMD